MIYSLIVIYNSFCSESKINEIKLNNIIPIIFDNSELNDFISKNKEFCTQNNIHYYSFNRNVGLAKAYNYIIKKHISSQDWIIILDQDTDVTNEFYEKINKVVLNADRLSYLASFMYNKNRFGPKLIKNFSKYSVIKQNKLGKLDDYLIGINTCSLFSRKLFEKVGLFNEELFLDYIDIDFFLRLANNGIKSKTLNILIKQHFFSKEKSDYKKVRNRLSIQKHDAKVFYSSTYLKGFFRKKYMYIRDILKFIILYCRTNNILWFLPLLFVKAKKEL